MAPPESCNKPGRFDEGGTSSRDGNQLLAPLPTGLQYPRGTGWGLLACFLKALS